MDKVFVRSNIFIILAGKASVPEVRFIRKKLFIRNGLIMTGAALLMRSLGMMLRVFLAGAAGSSGMGSWQLLLSVYAFFAIAATSGITITVTRIVGEKTAVGRTPQACYAAVRLASFASFFGGASGTLLLLLSDFISSWLLHDPGTAPALRILSFCIPFMSFSAAVRGYFSAGRKIGRITAEQLIEQLTEIIICIAAFRIYNPTSTAGICACAATGTVAAEIISFFYSAAIILSDLKKQNAPLEKYTHLTGDVLPVFIPCTANSALRSGLSAVENMLIPWGLAAYGLCGQSALSQYGFISGMAMPVIVFPSVFILPFASLIIPEMSQANALGRHNGIRHMAERMFSAAMLFSVPVTVIMIYFSGELGLALYGSSEAGHYIAVLAPVIPFMYLDSCVDGMLKGLDRQTDYFLCNLLDSIIRVALAFFLIPKMGIAGIIAIILFSEILNTGLSLWRLMTVSHLTIKPLKTIILPAGAALLSCIMIANISFPLPLAASLCIRLIITALCCGTVIFIFQSKYIFFVRKKG